MHSTIDMDYQAGLWLCMPTPAHKYGQPKRGIRRSEHKTKSDAFVLFMNKQTTITLIIHKRIFHPSMMDFM